MSLTNTPNANRLHIALFGRRNSGKSSLINKLLGENRVIVSNIAGTTRDAVDTEIVHNGVPYVFIQSYGNARYWSVFVYRYSGVR